MENIPKCAVCGTTDNLLPLGINDYNQTCYNHKKYARYYQLDKAKIELGLIKEFPDCKCAICSKPLTAGEKENILPEDFNKVCTEHRWMARFYNFFDFKKQFE